MLASSEVICPSSGLLTGVSSLISDFPKNILVPTPPKSHLQLSLSHPLQGRIAIVTDAGWDAVDAAAFCARWDCRASRKTLERFPGVLTRDVCCGRRSRVVLTPRRWRQVLRRCIPPNRVVTRQYPRSDGGKRARSPGRARKKPLKPLRREGRTGPVNLWCLPTCFLPLHVGPRVHRTPGFPCALFLKGGTKFRHNPGAARRGIERAYVPSCLKIV